MRSSKALCRLVAAVACGLMLLATPAVAAPPAAPGPVAVGHALPDVVMAGLNGPQRSLSSYRGRPLIINYPDFNMLNGLYVSI